MAEELEMKLSRAKAVRMAFKAVALNRCTVAAGVNDTIFQYLIACW
jgi:hypothetical protein